MNWTDEKLPAVLILLLAALTFHVNYVVRHETGVPILTIKKETIHSRRASDTVLHKDIMLELTNLSETMVLKDITVNCIFNTQEGDGKLIPNPRKVDSPRIVPIAPSTLVDTVPNVLANKEGTEFYIPVMQPGNSYRLKMSTLQNIMADEYPNVYIRSKEPIQTRNYTWQEWIIAHLFMVNFIMIVAWLVLIIIYIVKFCKNNLYEKEVALDDPAA